MNRVTRMAVGLAALIPVLGIAGWLFGALGVEGEAGAWMTLGAGFVWVVLMIWWALRGPAPAQLSDGARGRYLAFLRHAEYHPDDDAKRVRK